MMGDTSDTLLIVEDDDRLRSKLTEVASQVWKLRPLVAANFSHGLALARAHRPAFGAIDLMLPGGSGLDLIAAVREENTNARLVLMTGYATTDIAVEAMLAGADYVLCKPFSIRELASKLLLGESKRPEQEAPPLPFTIERLTWEQVHRVYRETFNNLSRTARLLGVDRTSVRRWLRKPRPPK
jgi:two-component system response regulator RegA